MSRSDEVLPLDSDDLLKDLNELISFGDFGSLFPPSEDPHCLYADETSFSKLVSNTESCNTTLNQSENELHIGGKKNLKCQLKKQREYYASASRRSRAKKKRLRSSFEESNAVLEKEQAEMKSKIYLLEQEIESIQTLSHGNHGKRVFFDMELEHLKMENSWLKSEVRMHRKMREGVELFVRNFSVSNRFAETSFTIQKNTNFLLRNLFHLAVLSSQWSVTNVLEPETNVVVRLSNRVVINALAELSPQVIRQAPEFDLNSLDIETRICSKSSNNIEDKFIRIDVKDVPVPRKDFRVLWQHIIKSGSLMKAAMTEHSFLAPTAENLADMTIREGKPINHAFEEDIHMLEVKPKAAESSSTIVSTTNFRSAIFCRRQIPANTEMFPKLLQTEQLDQNYSSCEADSFLCFFLENSDLCGKGIGFSKLILLTDGSREKTTNFSVLCNLKNVLSNESLEFVDDNDWLNRFLRESFTVPFYIGRLHAWIKTVVFLYRSRTRKTV